MRLKERTVTVSDREMVDWCMNSKQSKEKIDEILAIVRAEYPTQKALCERVGIDPKTLRSWVAEPSFKAMVDDARRDYLVQQLTLPAVRSLLRRIEGMTVTHERVTYVVDRKTHRERKVARVVETKQVPPDIQAILFVLCNLLPREFDR